MHRILRGALGVAFVLVLATGCNNSTGGVGPGSELPDGDLVATIVRTVHPDNPFYTIAFPVDPVPDSGESGTWEDAYKDDTQYAIVGSGYFLSQTSDAHVPLLFQVGTIAAGASVRVTVDQVRGTLSVFGLIDHVVWISIDVYHLHV
jgi:hypothetical protein